VSVPIVLVGGLAATAAERIADELAGGDTAVVHHDLSRVTEGVVRRRLRHRGEDAWTVLELGHGCVSCTDGARPAVPTRKATWSGVRATPREGC